MTPYDPAVYAGLAAAEEKSFWFCSRNALIVWAIRRFSVTPVERVLEVGCGTGYVLREIGRAFPHATLTGTDMYSEGLAIAADRVPAATLELLDVLEMPYSNAFDVIGAFDVIEHIDDDCGALRGLAQAARPRGLVLLTVPQHPALWSTQDDAAHHVRRYVAGSLHAKVRQAGLEIVRSTSFVSLLLPALYLTRRLPGRTTLGDLQRPRAVDAGLSLVMAMERGAIRAGVTFPAGGSRLIVARKLERATTITSQPRRSQWR
jgi:SAM-dependent methyltransferase